MSTKQNVRPEYPWEATPLWVLDTRGARLAVLCSDTFGRRVAALRKYHRISRRNLAAQVKCSPNTICLLEKGMQNIGIDIAAKIAEAFGCTLDFLENGR